MKSNLLSNIFCAWIISQGMFEIMDYGKLWAVRLWEGMRPLMGGCDTLRAFSGPGHPPVNLLGTVSLRQTTLELWPVAGAVPSLTSEITIPSIIVVLRLLAHSPIVLFTLNGFCRHFGRSMLVRACKYLQCNVHVIKPLQNFITFELS